MEGYAGAGQLSIDRVAAGQTIEVLRGGKLVARIVSAARNDARRPA